MQRLLFCSLIAGLALGSLACGDKKVSGAGGDPGGGDPAGPVTSQTRIYQTGGGGSTSSPSHRARVSVGAPQPYGKTATDDASLQAGPKATP